MRQERVVKCFPGTEIVQLLSGLEHCISSWAQVR